VQDKLKETFLKYSNFLTFLLAIKYTLAFRPSEVSMPKPAAAGSRKMSDESRGEQKESSMTVAAKI